MADAPNVDPQKPNPPQQSPTEKREEPTPVLRAELQIPPSVVDEYKSWQQEKKRHEKWKLPIEVVTLIAVVSTASIAGYQGCQMRKATILAEESSRSSNRAYITILGAPGLRDPRASTPTLGVDLFATGYTPALNVRKGITWGIRKLPLPQGFLPKAVEYPFHYIPQLLDNACEQFPHYLSMPIHRVVQKFLLLIQVHV